ncbi:methionyl-tRNA formyltransferase [Haloferula luteola]|uniref:Methionyl-tRNA formyltransferase n=1 Tax=Haloferula luteola TaxID=595692 RepID=A0A840VDA2_9BACT|nr:methionyl-tRNA formyltransferase [Haloferula luteola]MBB5352608.1 methionyl-tRNA formyltransferase [Haloferula luteola]
MKKPRIVFMGTGEIALPAFRWLLDSATPPVALVTQPDRPAGRRRELKPSELKGLAMQAEVPVLQPEKVRDVRFLDELAQIAPDLVVVMAYGQILPQRLIDLPPLGCVNLHASLLPKYRGAACIQAALDAGDAETGITLMHVVKALDAGDVILSHSIPISSTDTGGTLHDRLAEVAREVLADGLPGLLEGTAPRTPQEELGEASHVPKLDREDGRLDWRNSAERLQRRIRAYHPWPGCWCELPGGKRLKIVSASESCEERGEPGQLFENSEGPVVTCGEGALQLGEVQAEGSRSMSAADWWRGFRGHPPERLH